MNMASSHSWTTTSNSKLVAFSTLFLLSSAALCLAGNFNRDFDITWGLTTANYSLCRLIRPLVPESNPKTSTYLGRSICNSSLFLETAGTVTAYYLSSQGSKHDEIDFEFLENLSGDPYILHTNVYTQGKGDREQQFYLWFYPTADFHTYSILWNPQTIIFYVDATPIGVLKNLESRGVAFPMRVYASLWDADEWETRGGAVKTDWSQAPFTASFRNFKSNACVWKTTKSSCNSSMKAWMWIQLVKQG